MPALWLSRIHPAEWDIVAHPKPIRISTNIWYYIASRSGSIDTGDRVVDSITARFHLLAAHPHIGRARDEDLRPGLRSLPVGDYVLIYRIQEEDVLILRVLRGSRSIAALFD